MSISLQSREIHLTTVSVSLSAAVLLTALHSVGLVWCMDVSPEVSHPSTAQTHAVRLDGI